MEPISQTTLQIWGQASKCPFYNTCCLSSRLACLRGFNLLALSCTQKHNFAINRECIAKLEENRINKTCHLLAILREFATNGFILARLFTVLTGDNISPWGRSGRTQTDYLRWWWQTLLDNSPKLRKHETLGAKIWLKPKVRMPLWVGPLKKNSEKAVC